MRNTLLLILFSSTMLSACDPYLPLSNSTSTIKEQRLNETFYLRETKFKTTGTSSGYTNPQYSLVARKQFSTQTKAGMEKMIPGPTAESKTIGVVETGTLYHTRTTSFSEWFSGINSTIVIDSGPFKNYSVEIERSN